jgi:hypothetical protein
VKPVSDLVSARHQPPGGLNGTFKAGLIEMPGLWTGFEQVERAIFRWGRWYGEEGCSSV